MVLSIQVHIHLWVSARLGEMVVDLGRVRNGLQSLPDSSQSLGDELGGALLAQPKHHGRAYVKGVAVPLKMACAASRDDVPAFQTCGELARCILRVYSGTLVDVLLSTGTPEVAQFWDLYTCCTCAQRIVRQLIAKVTVEFVWYHCLGLRPVI